MATPQVLVRKLGRVSYGRALALQQSLATTYKAFQSNDVRMLC